VRRYGGRILRPLTPYPATSGKSAGGVAAKEHRLPVVALLHDVGRGIAGSPFSERGGTMEREG
jgi:hypothetical protein